MTKTKYSDYFESLVSKEKNKRLPQSFINHLIQFFIYISFFYLIL